MRARASFACVLVLISGCAYLNQERVAKNTLTRSHLRPDAGDRAAKCERLIDEMTASRTPVASPKLAINSTSKIPSEAAIDPIGFSRPQLSSADSYEPRNLDTSSGDINFGP